MDLQDLKVGDRVWIGKQRYGIKSAQLRPVSRLTRTQIVVAFTSTYEQRFKRDNGYRIGGGMFSDDIIGVADESECAEWDVKKAREANEAHAAYVEDERLKALRAELSALFPMADDKFYETAGCTYIKHEEWGESKNRKGLWTVEIHNLNEQQVRDFARLLATAEVVEIENGKKAG